MTDKLVTGMPIKSISVNPKPIAIGAKFAGACSSVAPKMIMRNMKVSVNSAVNAAVSV